MSIDHEAETADLATIETVSGRLRAIADETQLFGIEELEARTAFEAATLSGDAEELSSSAARLKSFAESRSTRDLAREHLVSVQQAAQERLTSCGYYERVVRLERLQEVTSEAYYAARGVWEHDSRLAIQAVRVAADALRRARFAFERAHLAAVDADPVHKDLRPVDDELWTSDGQGDAAVALAARTGGYWTVTTGPRSPSAAQAQLAERTTWSH